MNREKKPLFSELLETWRKERLREFMDGFRIVSNGRRLGDTWKIELMTSLRRVSLTTRDQSQSIKFLPVIEKFKVPANFRNESMCCRLA